MTAGVGDEVCDSDSDAVGETAKVGLGEGVSEGCDGIGCAWAFGSLKNGS